MATISIADNDARIQHSIGSSGNTASSTQFTIDYPFFSLDDINVTITNSAGVDTALSRGTGTNTFSVAGTVVDDGFSGGYIILNTQYTSSTVTITRDIPISRTSDFATSGPFNISSLNTELDKIYAVMQQIETNNDRSLTMPDSDALTAITLPGQTSRLGTVLGFNASTGQAEVGPTIANVNALSAITANINTVGGIASNVTTVAGIQANVSTVAGISSNVSSVAGNASNINSAVSNASNINTVAGAISNVNSVGGSISNVNSVAGNASNINTVAGKASLITSDFASDMALIDSTFVGKINLVTSDFVTDMAVVTADFISDLNDLATTAIIQDLDLLATSDFISDLNAVEGIKANVTTVAGISSNVTSVAGNSSNINSAVSNASNINSAVSNASNINSAVSNASNINSVVSNANNINTVAGAITNVNNVGGSIANVNTVASNLSGVNSFAERYRVQSGTPASDNDIGDLVFDTASSTLKVFGASGFQNAGSSVNGTSARFHYDISSAVTSVTGNDAAGNALAYDAGFIDVYVNGVRMSTADVTVTSGDTVTFASALASGDEVDIVAFGTFAVANIVSTGALNSGSITSGFGNINTGSSTITTTGAITGGTLTGTLQTVAQTNITSVGTLGSLNVGNINSTGTIVASSVGSQGARIERNGTTGGANIDTVLASGAIHFRTGTTERMRIEAAGNVHVATTSTNQANVGISLNANGNITAARDGGIVSLFNRKSDDGAISSFRKDGTEVGSIGVLSNRLYVGTDDTGLFFSNTTNGIHPWNTTSNSARDASIDLGNDSRRFKDLYLSGGVFLGGTGTANQLDDYEEGTWTPTLLASTTNPTYSSHGAGIGGTYVKIGKIVSVFFDMNVDISNAGSGYSMIGGLPIAPSSGVSHGGYSTVQFRNCSAFDVSAGTPLTGWVYSLDSRIYPETNQQGNSGTIQYSTGVKRVTGMSTYYTNN